MDNDYDKIDKITVLDDESFFSRSNCATINRESITIFYSQYNVFNTFNRLVHNVQYKITTWIYLYLN